MRRRPRCGTLRRSCLAWRRPFRSYTRGRRRSLLRPSGAGMTRSGTSSASAARFLCPPHPFRVPTWCIDGMRCVLSGVEAAAMGTATTEIPFPWWWRAWVAPSLSRWPRVPIKHRTRAGGLPACLLSHHFPHCPTGIGLGESSSAFLFPCLRNCAAVRAPWGGPAIAAPSPPSPPPSSLLLPPETSSRDQRL